MKSSRILNVSGWLCKLTSSGPANRCNLGRITHEPLRLFELAKDTPEKRNLTVTVSDWLHLKRRNEMSTGESTDSLLILNHP